MRKNLLLLLAIFFVGCLPIIAQVQPLDTDGNGYRNISTIDHLRWISENDSSWSWNFELDANINASVTATWNAGAGFSPIGNSNKKFTGKFNGNGYSIDSLYINRPQTNYIGLFGYTTGSNISNVGVTNCQVIGKENVGSLVGYNHSYSVVSNSYSTGSVSASKFVGGLVGYNNSYSVVSNSYSTSSVSGTNNIGGLLGNNYNSSTVSNSYSTGSVSGTSNVGGLVAYNGSIVDNSFWDTQTSGKTTSSGGIGKTTAEMKTKSTYTNARWDFRFIWSIDSTINNGYPHIIYKGITITAIEPLDNDSNGYRNISTINHLKWVSENDLSWSWNFELDTNINAAITARWNDGFGFSPIGNSNKRFIGKFNGNGYSIDSLYIWRPGTDNIGLFGFTSGSNISNVGVTNCQVIGKSQVGGLVGYNYTSTLVSNSYSTGNVSGSYNVGGLVGYNYTSSIISKCYSSCSVAGTGNNTGGLLGCNNTAEVRNSYSTGNVAGTKNVGGLLGYNDYAAVLNNCYSTGSVSGTSNVGGLLGGNSYASVNNSFWDTQTSGKATSYGGTGKTTAEMKTKSTYTSAGWDFTAIWAIKSNVNNGYPNLLGLNDLGIPILIAPLNDSINVTIAPTLVWDSTADATSYRVQLSTSNTFANLIVNDLVTTTSKSVSGLAYNTQYYWRVRAMNSTDTSAWSSVWSFTTELYVVTQTFSLVNGWNMISANVEPSGNAIASIMSPLSGNLQQVRNAYGQLYAPPLTNTLNGWNKYHAYQVRLTTASQLEIVGTPIVPEATPITLNQLGWYWLPYYRTSSMPIATALASISGKYLQVKTITGLVYQLPFSTTLSSLEPGVGYMIRLTSSNGTLTYPANTVIKQSTSDAPILEPKVFVRENNVTGKTAFIALDLNANEGDEVGVFTRDGMLVGSSVWQSALRGVVVWGDDEFTSEKDGASEGEELIVKVWNSENKNIGEVSQITLSDMTTNAKEYTLRYETDAVYFLKGNVEVTSSTLTVTPQPTTTEVMLNLGRASEGEVEVKLFNQAGQLMLTASESAANGIIRLNTSDLPSGVYQAMISAGGSVQTARIVIVR